MFKIDEFVYPKKINWVQVVKDLHDHGATSANISELTGLPWSTFARYKEGTEPKHSVGESILTLHTRYCGEALTKRRLNCDS